MNTQESTSAAPLLHKIPEACARLQVGRSTLYELIASGEIRAIKFGTATRIPESELQKVIAARMQVQA
ncbi:helix-turn-helix domain-containing protein [Aerolutibacter ruishenii]|uniref:AlpA family transcriptional regulator n=1 Tax=Aerolutibacter ruishenii TaxID=686800 RepID=A0A562LYJ2_9GAMM|nr:helix-turn-helix domain-containing protein [Lysobacter ruishenii]TWI12715.1 AlpA family transcriptional regulator [Lysobacter ruishenii]